MGAMISDMSPKNRPNETISRWFQTVFLRRYGDEHPTYPTYPA